MSVSLETYLVQVGGSDGCVFFVKIAIDTARQRA